MDTGIRINAVLTDVVMPSMGGPDLMVALRRTMPDLPVLFMSGYTDDVVVRHGLLDAGVSFIQNLLPSRNWLTACAPCRTAATRADEHRSGNYGFSWRV
jgi:FixJ family two-component response regulator